jgi:glycosyltransferase involved in cell wall biosynthesis
VGDGRDDSPRRTTCLVLSQDPASLGGVRTITEQAVNALKHGGLQPDLVYVGSISGPRVSLRRGVSGLPRRRSAEDGATVLPSLFPETQLLPDVFARWSLARLARRARWDACLVVGGGIVQGWAALELRVPIIVWAATSIRDERRTHIPHFRGMRASWHRFVLPRLEVREQKVLSRAAVVAAMSPHTARELEIVGGKPVETIEPCSSLAQHGSPEDGRSATLERELRLVYVGRVMDPRKQFQDALAAADEIARRSPSRAVTLAVTATEDEIARFTPPTTALQLELLGHPANEAVAAAVRGAHWLVLTSSQEGFGLVVADALTLGTPVAVTPCGGPEAMVKTSRAGIVCQAEEIPARVVSRSSPGTWRALSRAAQDFAKTRYACERLSSELCDAIDRAVRDRAVPPDRL